MTTYAEVEAAVESFIAKVKARIEELTSQDDPGTIIDSINQADAALFPEPAPAEPAAEPAAEPPA